MRSATRLPPGLAALHDQAVAGHLTTTVHRANSRPPRLSGPGSSGRDRHPQPTHIRGAPQPQRIISVSARHPARVPGQTACNSPSHPELADSCAKPTCARGAARRPESANARKQSFDNRLFVTLRHLRQGRCLASGLVEAAAPPSHPLAVVMARSGRPDDSRAASRLELSGRGIAGHGHAAASPASEPAPAISGVAPHAAGAAAARSPAPCLLCSGGHAMARPAGVDSLLISSLG
jgi:hypothetical protein